MTNETTYREKGRAVVLAALMVLSVVAMSAAFTGGAAAAENDVNSGAAVLDTNTDTAWQGQDVRINNESGEVEFPTTLNNDSTVELLDSDGEWVRDIDVDGQNGGGEYVQIDSSNLESGTYNVTKINGGSHYEFNVRTHSVDAEFSQDQVSNAGQGTSVVDLTIDSARGNIHSNVSANGLDAEDLESIFGDETDDGVLYVDSEDDYIVLEGRQDFAADFSGIDAGEYNFSVETSDTDAEDSASITVVEDDADRSFVNTPVGERGDLVEVTINTDGTTGSVVQVGDYDETNYEVGLNLDTSDYDGDEVTLQLNTAKAGLDGNEEDAWKVVGDAEGDVDDPTVEYHEINESAGNTSTVAGGLSNPLGAGDYELIIGSDWSNDDHVNATDPVQNDQDSTYLTLQERSAPGAVSTHTAPAEDDLESLEDFEETTVTETSSFAEEDHIVITADDFGMTGVLTADEFNNDENISQNLSDAGIYVEIVEQDPGTNQDAEVWNNSAKDGDLTLNFTNAAEYDGEQLILNAEADGIDYSDKDYDVTFSVTDENDYISDEDDEFESEFAISLEERDLEWADSAAEVPAEDGAVVSGDTNVAPGTEFATRASSSGNFVENADGIVAEDDNGDRYFEAEFQFGDYDAGTEFELRAQDAISGGAAADDHTIDSVLTESDGEQGLGLSVDAPTEITTEEDGTVAVTVDNHDAEEATVTVEFEIDGETQTEELTIGADSTASASFDVSGSDLGAGEYEWSVTAGDAGSDSGTLTVSEPDTDDSGSDDSGSDDSGSDDSGSDDSGSDDSGSDDSGSDDSSSGDGDDDGTPGFGVGVALVALLAAAMLALRRQN